MSPLRPQAVLELKRRSDRADGGGLIVRDRAWDSSLLVSERIEFDGGKGFIKLALDRGLPVVPVVAAGGQETTLFATRGESAAGGHRLGQADAGGGIAGRVRAALRHLAGLPGTPAPSGEDHRRSERRSTSLSASNQNPSPKGSISSRPKPSATQPEPTNEPSGGERAPRTLPRPPRHWFAEPRSPRGAPRGGACASPRPHTAPGGCTSS
jgi:hypothetical protein